MLKIQSENSTSNKVCSARWEFSRVLNVKCGIHMARMCYPIWAGDFANHVFKTSPMDHSVCNCKCLYKLADIDQRLQTWMHSIRWNLLVQELKWIKLIPVNELVKFAMNIYIGMKSFNWSCWNFPQFQSKLDNKSIGNSSFFYYRTLYSILGLRNKSFNNSNFPTRFVQGCVS